MDEWRKRLREAIKRTGKKYCAVAYDAGIDPTTLSRLLTGGPHKPMCKPSFQTVVNVIHAAGESVGWILGEYGYSLSEEERTKLRDAAATIIEVTSAGHVLRKDTPARKVRRTR